VIISTQPYYAGFETWQRLVRQGRHPAVMVDGVLIPDVIAANDRSGRAIQLVRRPDGSIALESPGRPRVRAVDGLVEILIPPVTAHARDGFG
jgi:hypothetical protein